MRILRLQNLFTLLLLLALTITPRTIVAADSPEMELYKELKTFRLSETGVKVQDFALDKDNMSMVFTGDFYFAPRIEGGVHGAVFIGQGRFRSEPRLQTEGASVKRFLNTTLVESTFT